MTEITDADRKAAAAFKDSVFVHPDILARAFAAHRLQERDRVVAWLRDQAGVAEDKADLAVDDDGKGVSIPYTVKNYRQASFDGYVAIFLNGEKVAELQIPPLSNGDTFNIPPLTISSD